MDLDGTLLLPDKTIDPINIEAIKKAKEKGISIVIASGREKGGISFVVDGLELEEGPNYVAGVNGGVIYDFKNKEYSVDTVFDQKDADKVFGLAHDMGFEAIALCGHVMYSYAPTRVRFLKKIANFALGKANDYGLSKPEWGFYFINDPKTHIQQDINKFILIQTKGFFKKHRSKIEEELSAYDVLSVGPRWYEIMPKGVNKGNAIKKIAKKEGIELDEILAFGDAENDISMLECVKYGYAMGNAMDNVKEIAYDVCDTNTNQGIAKTIYQYLEEYDD